MSATVYESIGDYSAKDCRLADYMRDSFLHYFHKTHPYYRPSWDHLDEDYKIRCLKCAKGILEKYETLYYGEGE